MPPVRLALALLPMLLAACTQTSGPEPVAANTPAPGVTPAGFNLPSGTGCGAEIGRYQAIMDNDRETGHVNKSVYDKVKIEIDRASAACAAGRDAEATGMILATRKRYGY